MQTCNIDLSHIDALLEDRGDINIGHLPLVGHVAVASDADHTLVMLRRRPGESFTEVLLRLDAAIEAATGRGALIDEVNG